ncbi:T9SS type A sorting domain-containing protein [Adhaeribacter rhizoryzae]|uniref:T9SS type A sorting domain-containing protein n=1 Tax=Adhaeribacter rhizoryzae TaxID=2607907 RepID=A0A5M6DR62_9BACT|nr:T9SS type A sorting domain-containing protein [Adhaeribacter rhizoryzae]KAA5548742.1 T9SS type A sorting domain-containing protein [Adhaeribacter rhizoryzae]
MPKFLIGLFCSLGFVLNSWGQVITPLESYPVTQSAKTSLTRHARTNAEGDTVSLPFFDDFAAYTGVPSAGYWQKGGGVHVNNQFGVNPPSVHVATFEGVDAAGRPYSPTATYGYTDTLTSKPIRLNNLNPTDSVYISFYWQAGGLGGFPEINSESQPSFLELEFKDRTGNWQQVWRQPGANLRTNFARVILPITNASYFHQGFQFRFRSSGLQRGTGDTWNLDYIYLDRNRRASAPDLRDVAISQNLNSLLKRYTAMPAPHFFAQPQAETNDSAFTRINNFNNLFAPIAWRGYVKGINPVTPADTFLRGNAAIEPLVQQYLINGKPNATAISNAGNFLEIKHSLFLSTRETNARLRQNDTVSRITVLGDYFAYDDGTAETNFSLNNFGSRQLAYRFDLNMPDNVTAIRVYLTKTNVPGTVINFRIWTDENGSPAGASATQKTFTIPPIDSLNRFYEITFPTPVAVRNQFYIGYSLTSSVPDFVNIGFDLNEEALGQIYHNNGGGWLSFTDEKGALLMRPVMGNVLSSPEEPEEPIQQPDPEKALNIFPNPSTGLINIAGNYQQVCLTDVAGKVIFCKTKAEAGNQLNLNNLSKGLYLLRFTQKNIAITKKIILTN